MAEFVELHIDAGATFNMEIAVSDDQGNPKNLANCSIKSQMRKSYQSTTAIDFDTEITSNADGLIVISLDSNTTANIAYGRYVHDLVLTNEDLTKERLFEGVVIVSPNVTQ